MLGADCVSTNRDGEDVAQCRWIWIVSRYETLTMTSGDEDETLEILEETQRETNVLDCKETDRDGR